MACSYDTAPSAGERDSTANKGEFRNTAKTSYRYHCNILLVVNKIKVMRTIVEIIQVI